ncbi:jg963 [Pararge aegeria aegeria]|uniref:Jg963 protein n=1 Tax=Pararge aegeria aegeria TaxID=348720 RepID=A0A8S4RV86_9NEOP|nr:jg963 [Pararge aegeria aegeria]
MTAPRRTDDSVELLPLKSMLVNNNYRDDEIYYPPAPTFNHNPSSSNLYDYTLLSKRTPASKRLLRTQPTPTPLLTLCGAPPPSRKREELTALANLKKKVAPALLRHDRRTSWNNNNNSNKEDNEPEQLDNRPKLLQRHASNQLSRGLQACAGLRRSSEHASNKLSGGYKHARVYEDAYTMSPTNLAYKQALVYEEAQSMPPNSNKLSRGLQARPGLRRRLQRVVKKRSQGYKHDLVYEGAYKCLQQT